MGEEREASVETENSMNPPITFFVCGKPQPAGSKRSFVYRRKGMSGSDRSHYGAATTDDNPRSKDWKTDVRNEAARNYQGEPWDCPIAMTLTFFLFRPKGHFGSGRNSGVLKDGAPAFPTVKPDSTKLCRGVEDALTSILWRDDSQIVTQHIHKRYGSRQGVLIEIREIAP